MSKKQPKKVILIVEDDECLREVIALSLSSQGIEIHLACSGSEAMEIMNQFAIDLVISDVRMPNGDGMSLLKQIRCLNWDHPPFVFISGYTDFADHELLKEGAQKVLKKPFSQNELQSAVSTYIGGQPA